MAMNVRYWETFWTLARHGTWPRREAGIFDATHLRWFTLGDAMNLLDEKARGESKTDLLRLQKSFVKAAGPYSQRKGITYAAWRELGVEPGGSGIAEQGTGAAPLVVRIGGQHHHPADALPRRGRAR